MRKVIGLNDEQQEALLIAVQKEIDSEAAGKDPKDVHIKYLGALIAIRDKLKKEDNNGS